MAHCPYDKIKNLEPAFIEIRNLEKIKESKPGIFYLKGQSFLHFHIKDEKIWADVRDGRSWGDSIDIPNKITRSFLRTFIKRIGESHKSVTNL